MPCTAPSAISCGSAARSNRSLLPKKGWAVQGPQSLTSKRVDTISSYTPAIGVRESPEGASNGSIAERIGANFSVGAAPAIPSSSESPHRLNVSRFCISQIAIRLPPRIYCHFKMRLKDIVYGALLICRLRWRTRVGRIRPIHATSLAGRNAGEKPDRAADGLG
jgi:hypothetical protein